MLRNFKLEKYLEDGKKTYSKREDIENLADSLTEKKFRNIVILGIGGTWAEWYAIVEYCRHLSDFPIYLENAAEFLVKKNMNYLSKDSLVITSSASGNTKEILEAVKLCMAEGIRVYGFTRDETTPLAKLLTKAIYNPCGDCEHSYLMYFMLALRLYHNMGYFDSYKRWADQMQHLYTNLIRIREEFEPRAAEIAKKYAKEPYTMFVGSGLLWGETYLFTMCILEEMQWVRTKAVTSADFFHGPLELVEKDVPVFLVMGEDEYRPLDERVERFARKFTDKLEVFDTKEFHLTDIDDEFRLIVTPMIITAILTERLAVHYELNTGHSLEFRRYSRKFKY